MFPVFEMDPRWAEKQPSIPYINVFLIRVFKIWIKNNNGKMNYQIETKFGKMFGEDKN
jgi:hypothetical protein